MNIYILDQQLNTVAIYDFYKSVIWSNRYYKTGDFELQIPLVADVKDKIQQDYYIYRDRDYRDGIIERPKIIEKIELIENVSENSLFVSGRDVSALLDRRVIYPTEVLNGSYEKCLLKIFDEHIISPSEAQRAIDIIEFEYTELVDDTIDTQVTGDSVLEYIEKVSVDYKIGYRMDFDINKKKFIFKVYKGTKRITDNPVIISRKFDNLIKYNYVNDKTGYKNMALVAGAGEGANRKTTKINDELMGLDRRELFVDARDLSNQDSSGQTISDSEYIKHLQQRGSEKLSENTIDITNSCEAETDGIFKFNEDYFLGDEIICESYMTFKERIVETTESDTAVGIKTELTFEEVEENG